VNRTSEAVVRIPLVSTSNISKDHFFCPVCGIDRDQRPAACLRLLYTFTGPRRDTPGALGKGRIQRSPPAKTLGLSLYSMGGPPFKKCWRSPARWRDEEKVRCRGLLRTASKNSLAPAPGEMWVCAREVEGVRIGLPVSFIQSTCPVHLRGAKGVSPEETCRCS